MRRLLAPEGVEQFRRRGRATTAEQEYREQGSLLWGADRQRLITAPGPHRAKYGEAHVRAERRFLLHRSLPPGHDSNAPTKRISIVYPHLEPSGSSVP